jgi:hypothetical protein
MFIKILCYLAFVLHLYFGWCIIYNLRIKIADKFFLAHGVVVAAYFIWLNF